ncbi:MAG: hypothetical protein JWL91_1535 [Sphingomonas bacterium]|nr:hypothetical protein [Sphingomonas bacterium]MDB5689659.1 hypothetical protein [Sphingomonas bacterium]
MPPRIRHAALALIAAAGVAQARAPAPIATPIGKAEDCVPLQSIRETRVRDDQTIDFYMRNRKIYRNVLAGRCPQLGFEERFTYQTSLSQLCSTDIITVLQSPNFTRGASCGLGKFQPVKLSPR